MPVMIATAGLLGALGLLIGSFLAATAVRLPREESIVWGRSHCMSCAERLPPWRMVPVLSWLLQKGRCASCGAAVSPRYLLIETLACVIGVWAALATPDPSASSWMILATAILGWQLLLIAAIDAEHFWLPDRLTWPLALSGLVVSGVAADAVPWASLIGLVAGFGFLWLLAWAYRRFRGRDGLGGGDPFLLGAIGAWVGWTGLPSVTLWAGVAGLSVIAARLVLRRPLAATDRLPFGVFLSVGAWLTWLYGPLGL